MGSLKEVLILYGRVQGFTIELSTVCLHWLYGKLDALLHLYYYELLLAPWHLIVCLKLPIANQVSKNSNG